MKINSKINQNTFAYTCKFLSKIQVNVIVIILIVIIINNTNLKKSSTVKR